MYPVIDNCLTDWESIVVGQQHTSVVAVLGAAGGTGRAVVDALLSRGVNVRALIHRPAQESLFTRGVDCRIVELDDRATLIDALRGVGAAYYIPPVFNAAEERFGDNVIAAAEAAGLKRLVYHSVLHAPTPDMPHHARKARVELALRHSSLEWTIVQPAMYAQTPLAFLDLERGVLSPGFDVERPFNPIGLYDLAEAVARILTEDDHEFATYELAGSERLTFIDMARIISAARGTTIQARAAMPEQLIERIKTQDYAPAAAEEIRLMMAHYDRHGLVGNGRVLTMLLGREPIGFAAIVGSAVATK